MHDESLIHALLHQVDELMLTHQAVAVEEIEVEVGPLSGVEPFLLKDAFERLKSESSSASATLSIVEVGLVVLCRDCQRESQLGNFHFVCHECGSTSVQILCGAEFRLLSVRLQQQGI